LLRPVTAACVFGCAGLTVTAHETAFFREVRPWGFILFGRNVESPDQVRALIASLRDAVDNPDAPVMIDQEGGRVRRLRPPHWRRYPPVAAYATLKLNLAPESGRELARLGGRLIAHDLAALGITIDCAPVLDVPTPGAHDVIGDRAFATSPDEVAGYGRAMAEGLLAGGVLPVIKHIPGHGRAGADSHLALPVVEASLAELEATDFFPFQVLSDMPLAMTAHVVYSALDPRRPATTSRAVIAGTIRERLGFDGLLVSDDLSMNALSGDLTTRARAALAAGCDIVLHCSGDPAEMQAVAAGTRRLAGAAARRARAALGRIPRRAEPFDAEAAGARFEALFTPAGGGGAA
jgi:beta-N-acetylhexosaminidase